MSEFPIQTHAEVGTAIKDIPMTIAYITYQKDRQTPSGSHTKDTHRIALVQCNNHQLFFDQDESRGSIPPVTLEQFNNEVVAIEIAKNQISEIEPNIIEVNRKKYFDSDGMIMLKGFPVFEQEYLQKKFESLKSK